SGSAGVIVGWLAHAVTSSTVSSSNLLFTSFPPSPASTSQRLARATSVPLKSIRQLQKIGNKHIALDLVRSPPRPESPPHGVTRQRASCHSGHGIKWWSDLRASRQH